jgi:RNA polymerase sigma-70 factor (ECF subfamily)
MGAMRDERVRQFLATDYSRVVGVVSLVCDRGTAEDAVQEAVLTTWRRADDSLDYTAWVTAVALNKARSSRRRRAAEQRAFARLPEPVTTGHADSTSADVARALSQLSVRQRQVTVLRYWLDLDVAGIARVLGVSDGTVKTQLARARAALAPLLRLEETDHAR